MRGNQMIETTFEPVMDGSTVTAMRLTVTFNGKYVNHLDYAPDAVMTQDDLDNYIAGKLSGLLS
jgi:hypothetical protein